MTNLTVSAYTGTEPVLGKSVSTLQSGITVSDSAVTGTLYTTSGYTGYSENTADQSGIYLVLQTSSTNENAVITAEIVNATDANVKKLDNGILIVHGGLSFGGQKLKVTASSEGHASATKEFDLSGINTSTYIDPIWSGGDPAYGSGG